MESKTFRDRFLLDSYIAKRALEIENLEERTIYKEISQHMMLELYQEFTSALDQVEKKLHDDIVLQARGLSISIGVASRQEYDITNGWMYPMLECDLQKPPVINLDELKTAWEKQTPFFLYSIYFKLDYLTLKKQNFSERTFHGTIHTKSNTYPVRFSLRKNTSYLEQVQALYPIFLQNYYDWTTVCTAHLQKFYDVLLEPAEEVSFEEEIEEILIDFQELSDSICFDWIPVWNLSRITEKTSSYPIRDEAENMYRHRVYLHNRKERESYLVSHAHAEIRDITIQDCEVQITCDREEPLTWEFIILHSSFEDAENYQAFSNQEQESFVGDFIRFHGNRMKNRAEISRMVRAFPYSGFLVYQGVTVKREYMQASQTYDMDEFIRGEFGGSRRKETLLLEFCAADERNYLNYDIMSFLTTRVGEVFGEYQCIGILRQGEDHELCL